MPRLQHMGQVQYYLTFFSHRFPVWIGKHACSSVSKFYFKLNLTYSYSSQDIHGKFVRRFTRQYSTHMPHAILVSDNHEIRFLGENFDSLYIVALWWPQNTHHYSSILSDMESPSWLNFPGGNKNRHTHSLTKPTSVSSVNASKKKKKTSHQ